MELLKVDGDNNSYIGDLNGYSFIRGISSFAEEVTLPLTSSQWIEIQKCEGLIRKNTLGTLTSSDYDAFDKCVEYGSNFLTFKGHSHGTHVGGIYLHTRHRWRI